MTKMKCVNNKLYHNDVLVEAVGIREALLKLIKFLKNGNVVLVGHNIKSFDIPVLFTALQNTSLEKEFEEVVSGFLDTLSLFKNVHPGLASYKQESLYKHFFDETYAAHSALQDVIALSRLFSHIQDENIRLQNTMSFNYMSLCYKQNCLKKVNMVTWEPFVLNKTISKGLSERAAASGLKLSHVKLAFQRNGERGIRSLFTEKNSLGKPRVTSSNRVIERIAQAFST